MSIFSSLAFIKRLFEIVCLSHTVNLSSLSFPQLDEGTPPEPKGSFVDYQTTVVKYSKAIAVTAQEMVRVISSWIGL